MSIPYSIFDFEINDTGVKVVKIIKIESYATGDSCCREILNFIQLDDERLGSKRLLLIFADRDVASTSMINLVVSEVNNLCSARLIAHQSVPLIIMIQHFPAESLQFGPVFDSLPFNGWDMSYCDSFGYQDYSLEPAEDSLSRESSADGSIQYEDDLAPDTKSPRPESIKANTDSRRWLQCAFGLQSIPSAGDVVLEFRQSYFEVLKKELPFVRFSAVESQISLESRGIVNTKAFYSGGRILPVHVESVMGLLIDRSYVLEALLEKFSCAWASQLSTYVEEVSKEQLSGKSLESMLSRINASFGLLLCSFAHKSIKNMFENYGFEALVGLPRNETLERDENVSSVVRFTVLVVSGMRMPSFHELRLMNAVAGSIISISSQNKYPPKLPFFSELISQINNLYGKVASSKGLGNTFEDILQHAHEVINLSEYKTLRHIIELVEGDRGLLEMFIQDTLGYIMGFDTLYKQESYVALELVSRSTSSVLRLVLDKSLKDTVISALLALRPLRYLYDKVQLSDAVMDALVSAGNIEPGILLQVVEHSVINDVWRIFHEIFSGDTIDFEDLIWSRWTKAIRTLCYRFSSWSIAVNHVQHDSFVTRIAVLSLIASLLSSGFNLGLIFSVGKAAEEKLRFHFDSDTALSREFNFSFLLEILIEYEIGSDADMIVSDMIRWFEGVDFSDASVIDVALVLKGLGSDSILDPSDPAICFNGVSLLQEIQWIKHILKKQQLSNAVGEELTKRNCALRPFAPYHVRTAIAALDDEALCATVNDQSSLLAIVFQSFIENIRAEGLDLRTMYDNFDKKQDCRTVMLALEASAFAILIVEESAKLWKSQDKRAFVNTFTDHFRDSILKFIPGLENYFLVSLMAVGGIDEFLGSIEVLKTYGYDPETRHVPSEADGSLNRAQGITGVGRGVSVCPHHGAENLIWKCMFCCTRRPSTFLCGGVDNYCEICHRAPGRVRRFTYFYASISEI